MRVTIPTFETKQELFVHLREKKDEIIKEKRALPIFSDVSMLLAATKATANKAEVSDRFSVKLIANLANWMDSHDDVMLPGSWLKSINEKGTSIPVLRDHEHSIGAKIGTTLAVYAEDIVLADIGYTEGDVKQAEGLIFEFEPKREYDEKLYLMYKNGEVTQHSIGLQYVKIDMAINEEGDSDEYKNWLKYFPQVINKEKAEQRGYFFAVKEAKIFENSAVLFGSNVMTPVLGIENIKALPTNVKKQPSLFLKRF